MRRTALFLAAIALFFSVLLGCEEPGEQPLAGPPDDLLGDSVFTSSAGTAPWTGDLRSFVSESMRLGRIAAVSGVFETCLDRTMRFGFDDHGPYIGCAGDPFSSSSALEQVDKTLFVCRTPDDVTFQYEPGGDGNAHHHGGGTWSSDGEDLDWCSWLGDVESHLEQPLCREAEACQGATPDPNCSAVLSRSDKPLLCRWEAYPWPYSQAAGLAWHEVMHHHDYGHGDNFNNAAARIGCNLPGAPADWNFQRDTVPYIVQHCIDYAITESTQTCAIKCPSGSRAMLRQVNSQTCECVADPQVTDRGVGLLRLDVEQLDDLTMVRNESELDGWILDRDAVDVEGVGDFDGDGRDELLIRSTAGLEIVERVVYTTPALPPLVGTITIDTLSTQAHWAFGVAVGGWILNAGHTVVGVGDFNGDGRDDLVLRSSSYGIGLAGLDAAGNWAIFNMVSFGTALGTWTLRATDVFDQVGAFTGELGSSGQPRAELLVHNASTGFAVLTRNASTRRFEARYKTTWGAWVGTWHTGSADTFPAKGDFDGDGRDEIMVRSAWGLGFLDGRTTTSLQLLNAYANGTSFGGWSLAATDAIEGVVRFSGGVGSGGKVRDDLLLSKAGRGIAIFARSSAGVFSKWSEWAYGTSHGGWMLGAGDELEPVANLTGGTTHEILISSGWGVGVVVSTGVGFEVLGAQPFLTPAGSWLLLDSDEFLAAGDFDGNGADELFVASGTP